MGQLINLKCEKCGYETNLGIGAGMTYNDLEMVITFFDKDTQEKIRALVGSTPKKLWNVTKEIAVCEKCGKISAIAVFRSQDAGGNPIEYRAKCQCGSSSLNIYDSNEVLEGRVSIPCPACGDGMKASVQGMWD